jgi:5-deoxy-D-glucuronate isomerase
MFSRNLGTTAKHDEHFGNIGIRNHVGEAIRTQQIVIVGRQKKRVTSGTTSASTPIALVSRPRRATGPRMQIQSCPRRTVPAIHCDRV